MKPKTKPENSSETETEDEDDNWRFQGIRHADDPRYKERVMSQLFGEFIGYLKSKGLTKGNEFEWQTEEIFSCSKKILWLDQHHPDWQITVYASSIGMDIGFGVVKKKNGKVTKDVVHRMEFKNLRYKISSGTPLELIDAHRALFDQLFDDFRAEFEKLESDLKVRALKKKK